ncbi:MAG: N-acetylmuramidase family protein, partial [Candidatus Adiutrix sp.]|nr:N-acetylmuramidase family protein [Candidatus Adiutrix sp.]
AGGVDELFSLGPLAPAALCSVSWGLFKIMGFNWRLCGYKSLQDFIKAMYRDEASHLVAAMGFLKGSGLIPALRSLDWAAFAKGYNGPGYSASKYDLKLARAYKAAKG